MENLNSSVNSTTECNKPYLRVEINLKINTILKCHNMVIIKEINQKIFIAAIIISFALIVGSIFLHVRQKHHLGRLNIGDSRVKPTDSVATVSQDVAVHGQSLNRNNLNAIITESKDNIDYPYINVGDDYSNDLPTTMAIEDNGPNESSHEVHGNTKSTDLYVMDNNNPLNSYGYEDYYSDEHNAKKFPKDKNGLTKDCLKCLCNTVSGCKPFKCALIDPCGIYGISKYYWIDGGRQTTVENSNDYSEENDEHREYLRCVNNEKCAAATVANYMKRYQKDCNNDGIIDCKDYITLHVLGPSGCMSKQLSMLHKIRMNSCLK